MSNKGFPAHEVTQLHYTGWPDFGVPSNTKDLLTLNQIKSDLCNKFISNGDPVSPVVVVHCSAGVGRTGTLISLDTLTKQIEEKRNDINIAGQENPVDVYKCVLKMREDRGSMVTLETK